MIDTLSILLNLTLALLGLYITTLLTSTNKRDEVLRFSFNRYAELITLTFLATSLFYFMLSIIQIASLISFISSGKILSVYISDAISALYLFSALLLSYAVFKGLGALKLFAPQFNLQNILIVQGLAVLWIYLETLSERFYMLTLKIGISFLGVFIVSVVLAVYTATLLFKYYKLVRRGVILENIDFKPYIYRLNLAFSLFGFSILSMLSTKYSLATSSILIAGHAIIMNHTFSIMGRDIKRTLGIR